MYPSSPKNARYLLSGETVNFSKLFSFRPTKKISLVLLLKHVQLFLASYSGNARRFAGKQIVRVEFPSSRRGDDLSAVRREVSGMDGKSIKVNALHVRILPPINLGKTSSKRRIMYTTLA